MKKKEELQHSFKSVTDTLDAAKDKVVNVIEQVKEVVTGDKDL